MWGRLHIKTTQILPYFCCIPLFQSFLSLYIPLSFANFSHLTKKKFAGVRIIVVFLFVFIFLEFSCVSKVIHLLILAPLKKILYIPLSFANFPHLTKKKFAGVRIIVVFLFVFIFLEFSCVSKVIHLLILAPLKKILWKESKFKTMKKRRKESAETKNCVSKLCASCLHLKNFHPHSPQRKFCDAGLNRDGCNKMESVFLDRKVMLLFRIELWSCQILVIFVKCGR